MARRGESLRAEVEAAIREAFRDTRLEDGISLRQAAVIDDSLIHSVDETEFEAVRAGEVTGDWTAIPRDELDSEHIAHLDAEGLRYYLPAFMLRLLDDYGDVSAMWSIGTIHALDQRDGHPLGFLDALTAPQRRAIALYVSSLQRLVELKAEDAATISRSFRDVWVRYLEADAPGAPGSSRQSGRRTPRR